MLAVDPRRVARLDLRSVTSTSARDLLSACEPAIEAEVGRWSGLLARGRGLDADDLRAVGRVAVLEASLTYQPDRGRTLRTWAGLVVHQRISEVAGAACALAEHEVPAADPDGLLEGDEHVEADDVVDPQLEQDQRERLAWLARALAKLPPRRRAILAAKLRGESQREVGRTLGISDARTSQEVDAAVAELRALAVDAGLLDE